MLQKLFFIIIVKPLLLIIIGLNIRHNERLPKNGPAIIIANHNSHLDTLVLMNLFPLKKLHRIRPVAAADYFMKNRWIAWFATTFFRIIPISRKLRKGRDPFTGLNEAIDNEDILIFFPEGSRGEAEKFERFKSGIAHLSERYPDVPIYPVFLHGLGKILPKGDPIFVPFFCDIFVGEAVYWNGERKAFLQGLHEKMDELRKEGKFPKWE
jgi:1-acyl-sn-glycerol-3-phosphate acyltransferase